MNKLILIATILFSSACNSSENKNVLSNKINPDLADTSYKRSSISESNSSGDSTKLEITFIGNEAFEITDGKVTLLSDFPYVSGAFGYMKYDMDKIRPKGKVLCLITHEHDDHFSPNLWAHKGWYLAASPRITTPGVEAFRLAFSDTILFEGIRIIPQKTPHTKAHYSYLVEWHGKRFYFPGDTDAAELLPKEMDVLFITPWLFKIAKDKNIQLHAKSIVLYHHTFEKIDCINCIVPKQGDKL
jgi:Beta-lactamase superfamily domain